MPGRRNRYWDTQRRARNEEAKARELLARAGHEHPPERMVRAVVDKARLVARYIAAGRKKR